MGVDPLELPIRRLISLIYFIRVRNLKESERDKHDTDLFKPPKSLSPEKRQETPRKGFDPSEEMSMFQSVAMQTAQLEGS